MTVATVVLPQNIRNSDTPDKMPDRIPPRMPTAVDVNVFPNLSASGQLIEVKVFGANSTNGSASFNGHNTISISSAGTVQISGDINRNNKAIQTTGKRYAGNLHLGVGSRNIYSPTEYYTDGFSVAAIPQNIVEKYASAITGTVARGALAEASRPHIGLSPTVGNMGI